MPHGVEGSCKVEEERETEIIARTEGQQRKKDTPSRQTRPVRLRSMLGVEICSWHLPAWLVKATKSLYSITMELQTVRTAFEFATSTASRTYL